MIEGVGSFILTKNWLPQLYDKFIEIRKTREDEINATSDIFGDLLALSKEYVEPDCQQFNPADDDEQDSNIIRIPAFTYLQNTFFNGVKEGGGKNQLLILSDAGMGKTSLLSILWMSYINSFWPKKYNCSLLKLGSSTLKEIKLIKNQKNHILLLDGLDEDPLSWGDTEKRIRNLLQASENFYRVIITCRTQFFSGGRDPFDRRGRLEVSGYICPVIYLSLFSKDQVDKYLKQRFKVKSLDSKLEKISTLIDKMGNLRFRPMLLSHAEDLLASENQKWTEYNVYEALILAWLHRERRKKVWEKLDSPPSTEELFSVTTNVAYTLQKNGSSTLSKEEFMFLVEKDKSAEIINYLDIGGRSFFNKNSKGEFRFSHFSVQEFLLTRSVIFKRFKKEKSIKGTNQILRFTVAWLSEKESEISGFPWGVYKLKGLSFRNFELKNYDFRNIDLRNVDFSGSDLANANFTRADLRGANLKGALNVDSTVLKKAIYDDKTIWPENHGMPICGYYIGPKSNLKEADLSDISLTDCNLNEANLTDANLSNSDLERAQFKKSVINGVSFNNSNITDADFSMSEIRNTDYSEAMGERTKFANSKLYNCVFRNSELPFLNANSSSLKSVDFGGSNLESSIFEEATFSNVSFNHATLTDVTTIENYDPDDIDFRGSFLDKDVQSILELGEKDY